jgi:hypothetical protein
MGRRSVRRAQREQMYVEENDGKLHYPVPQAFTIPSKNSPPPLSVVRRQHWQDDDGDGLTHAQVSAIHKECIELGFNQNAIVAKRMTKPGNDWRRTSHLQWGVVSHLNHAAWKSDYYAPIQVHWFQPSAHDGVIAEPFWPHELYVVHPSVSRDHLEQMFEIQDEEDNAKD